MLLPDKIRDMLQGENYKTDSLGMSEASVYIYKDKVLKIQTHNEEAENEYSMLEYLSGKLPVPPVYAKESCGGKLYILMGRCDGEISCSNEYMKSPELLSHLLANGLRALQNLNISDCPSNQGLSRKLAMAAYNVEHGLVDIDNTEPDTFGANGFKDPADLLQWLCDNRPDEELCFSHGDYCLPNIFGIRDKITGYIDLGKAGIADKWCDIALCHRSLLHNFSGKYNGGKSYPGYDENLLFRELGIEPDWEKIRYYRLLDELF